MKIHYFQHVPFETPGKIGLWARSRGHEIGGTHLYKGETPPSPRSYDWLVVLGGPMRADDETEHPWLVNARAEIKNAIDAGKTVIGICLGAQLVAAALGANVYRNDEKEIGWFPVSLTDDAQGHPLAGSFPPTFTPLHWHSDTFELPAGATLLASTLACPHQMFAVGERVLGMQFHLEMTRPGVADLIENCRANLTPGRYVQTVDDIMGGIDHLQPGHAVLQSLLGQLE